MRIGIDIDEVLCRTNNYFLFDFNKKNNTSFKREELVRYDYNCLKGFSGEEVFEALVNHLEESLIFYDILEGSKEYLIKLKKEGHQLFIITSRWIRFKNKTIKWLNSHFGDAFFDDVFIYNDRDKEINKADIAFENNLDILIEDAPKYAFATAKKGIKVLLLNHPWNIKMEEYGNIIRVYNWKEIYNKIKKLNIEIKK